jgi:hypothetical protein
MKTKGQTDRLKKGSAFHMKIQSEWKKEAQGYIKKEEVY